MRPETEKEWPNGKNLIIDGKAEGHLPIRATDDGPENHNLMGCAHAALCSPEGYRGQPYRGPRQTEAIAKLRTAYQQEGMEWPDDGEGKCSDCHTQPCTMAQGTRASDNPVNVQPY